MPKEEYKDRKYSIVPYDPQWTEKFEAETADIRNIFGKDALGFEHVGSTAVRGMSGKPTIDILVLVEDPLIADRYDENMRKIGYEPKGAYVMPDSRLFVKKEGDTVLVNVHVFGKSHPHVREMTELRDHLREHPETVKEYSELKSRLYRDFGDDYAQYRKRKDEYMNELKKRVGTARE